MTAPPTVRVAASSSMTPSFGLPVTVPQGNVIDAIRARNSAAGDRIIAALASPQVIVSQRRVETIVSHRRVEWIVANPRPWP